MDHLRQSELSRLLDFVRDCHAIHDFEPFECFLARIVVTLAQLLPGSTATYNEMNPAKAESYNIGSDAEVSTPKAGALWAQYMHEHPVLAHAEQISDGAALRISDFWSQRQMHNSGLYSGFYRYYDIEDALCISLSFRPPRLIGVGWHRDRRFTERERLTAQLVRPHILQAWRNAKLLSAIHDRLQLLEQGLAVASLGVLACDSEGRVQFINAFARQYLSEYCAGAQHLDRRLPQDLFRWMQEQNTLLLKNEAPPVRLPLELHKPGRRLIVHLLSNAEANLLLLEEQNATRPAVTLEGLGLSRRESEVLTWVVQGKTNREIAIILGISVPTAKKHVEHIFKKLGVETRTAAAAIARHSSPPNE